MWTRWIYRVSCELFGNSIHNSRFNWLVSIINPLLHRIKKSPTIICNNRSLHIIISFIGHSSVSFNFIFQSLIIISSIHRNGRPEQGRPFFCGIFRTGQTESDKSDMVRRVGHGQKGRTWSEGAEGDDGATR